MTFEVEINGRTRIVLLERQGVEDRFQIDLDGVRRFVDAKSLGSSTLSLIFSDEAQTSHEAHIFEATVPGELTVHVAGSSVTAVVNGRRVRRGHAQDRGLPGEQRVVTPMPGRVLRVLVEPGDLVRPDQGLVVIEAMKMENELRSPKAGRVKEVAAREGMTVEAGRLLVTVE